MSGFLNSKIESVVSRNSRVLIFFSLAVLIFYGNILFGNFVFDDNIFIENNVQIRSLVNFSEIYQSSTTLGSGLSGDNFYRPNQQFIYTLLYSLFGLTPFFFHLVPLALHVLNGFLLFILFTWLGVSRRSSFLGALIFLLHPALTQAVSYISGLSEPLVTTSILSVLLIFIRAMEKMPTKKFLLWLLSACAIFSLGLLSKESQFTAFPLTILLSIFLYKNKNLDNWVRPASFIFTFGVLSALYIYLRLNFLNFTGNLGLTDATNLYTQSLSVRLTTFVHVLPEYFKMLLFPARLYYEKPYFAVSTLLSPQSLVSLAMIILGAYWSLLSLIRRNGKAFFGLGWFILALAPFSGIIPTNAIYLEHWLYLPIIGLIFCLVILFDKYREFSKKILPGILLVVLVVFGFRIMVRNLQWADPIKFYENELRFAPESARLHNNLAMELSDRRDCPSAIKHYREAIVLSDSYPQTHHNLARCLEATGELNEAFLEYLRALEIEPSFPYSLAALYNLLSKVGDLRAEYFLELYERRQNGEVIDIRDIQEALVK